jgi:hypothetical protein
MSPSFRSTAASGLPASTKFTWLTLDMLEAQPTRAGAAYWRSLCRGRRFPSRNDLKPRELASLLPYISLINVIDGGADFVHRIVGDVIVQAFDVPIQHRRFSEIAEDAPNFIARSLPQFRKVVDTGAPVAWSSLSGHDVTNVVFTYGEMLLLPLGSGNTVDHILGIGWYRAAHER